MRMADFFLGSRQFFGLLAPGLLWLAIAVLVLSPRSLEEFVSSLGVGEAAILVAISFVLGTALETLSFRTAVFVSARLSRAAVSRELHDTDLLPLDVPQTLFSQARSRAMTEYPNASYLASISDREFAQFCKQFLLEKTRYLAKRVSEYEAEINLLAMFPVPLVLFAIAWPVDTLIGSRPISWSTVGGPLLIVPTAVLALAYALISRLHPLRREETEQWLKMFLWIHAVGAEREDTGSST